MRRDYLQAEAAGMVGRGHPKLEQTGFSSHLNPHLGLNKGTLGAAESCALERLVPCKKRLQFHTVLSPP